MTILTQLFEIIVLKRRTSDVTYDPIAAALAFAAAVASSYFHVVLANVFSNALPFVIAQGIAQAVIFFALLSINKKQTRLVQTYTALFGVSAILQFLGLIVLQVPGLAILGLFFTLWNFYLMVIILRDAIECSTPQSVLITIAYHFVIGLLLLSLFPEMFEQMQSIINPEPA